MLAYRFNPRLVPWLRGNASNYDVVVVNGIWQYTSFAVWRALRKSRTPYAVFTHGMLDPWSRHTFPLKHLKKSLYWPWGEYRVLRDAAAVLFTCEEERLRARRSFRLYSAKETVVKYGTTVAAGERASQVAECFDSYPELRHKRIALYMGRIHPKKGCDLVLQAFASILSEDARWHLVIAGPDQTGLKDRLLILAERLGITRRITWPGMVSGSAKWGLFGAAEVFFLPSHQENFGIVVAEALACGVPCLISDKVNIWREVRAGWRRDSCGGQSRRSV